MHKHKLHRMVSKFSVHMLLCGVQEMDTEHADNLPPMFKDICIRSFFSLLKLFGVLPSTLIRASHALIENTHDRLRICLPV